MLYNNCLFLLVYGVIVDFFSKDIFGYCICASFITDFIEDDKIMPDVWQLNSVTELTEMLHLLLCSGVSPKGPTPIAL